MTDNIDLMFGTLAVSPIVKSDQFYEKSDLNQITFLMKIRPKSDQNFIKIRPSQQNLELPDNTYIKVPIPNTML